MDSDGGGLVRSEFGRGYATCLRQFTFHRARLAEDVKIYRDMRTRYPQEFNDQRAVEMWFNGSSDHLRDLVKPRRGITLKEWHSAKGLQGRALDIGHGFLGSSKSTVAEAEALLAQGDELLDHLTERGYDVTTLEGAVQTDRALGLKPEEGDWSCRSDITRRAMA